MQHRPSPAEMERGQPRFALCASCGGTRRPDPKGNRSGTGIRAGLSAHPRALRLAKAAHPSLFAPGAALAASSLPASSAARAGRAVKIVVAVVPQSGLLAPFSFLRILTVVNVRGMLRNAGSGDLKRRALTQASGKASRKPPCRSRLAHARFAFADIRDRRKLRPQERAQYTGRELATGLQSVPAL